MRKCMIYLLAFILAIFMERITKESWVKFEINTVEPENKFKEHIEPWLIREKTLDYHARYDRIARFEEVIPNDVTMVTGIQSRTT